MKRILTLLIPLLLLLAACASGGDDFAPADVAEPGADAVAPTTAAATDAPATVASAGEEAITPAETAAPADDPTLARERDWKLGDLESPAVTIIEYGDFQ